MQYSDGTFALFDGTAALKPRAPRKLALVTQQQLLHVVGDKAAISHACGSSAEGLATERLRVSMQTAEPIAGVQSSPHVGVHPANEFFLQPAFVKRRVLVALVAFVLAFGVVAMAGSAIREAYVGGKLSESRTEYVTVQPGDSLWGIAQRSRVSGVSTDEVVSWISSKNGLSANDLKPGQEILVPVVG